MTSTASSTILITSGTAVLTLLAVSVLKPLNSAPNLHLFLSQKSVVESQKKPDTSVPIVHELTSLPATEIPEQAETHVLNSKTNRTAPRISSHRTERYASSLALAPPPPPYVSTDNPELAQSGVQDWPSKLPQTEILTASPNKDKQATAYNNKYARYIYSAQGSAPADSLCSGQGVTVWKYGSSSR